MYQPTTSAEKDFLFEMYFSSVTKIDDVDSSLQKEVKKTRSEVDKLSTQVKFKNSGNS